MVDKYFRGKAGVDSVENVIISWVSFPYSYPQWMITVQNFWVTKEKPVSSGITIKRTYEEGKMKNPLSFALMMTAECRTGGHSQQIIYSTFHSFLISSICSRMLFILLRDL